MEMPSTKAAVTKAVLAAVPEDKEAQALLITFRDRAELILTAILAVLLLEDMVFPVTAICQDLVEAAAG